ncbi:MAG: argininosuccinate lyase [Planctomycetota bacterium]
MPDTNPDTPKKAWGGRFSGTSDPRVEAFTESISFDARLAPYDVAGSKAHATMLAEVGLLTADEKETICATLDEILGEIERGELPFSHALEDIHMHIESRLIEKTGDVGRKLHTARSRNDQIATDTKLFLRDAVDRLDRLLKDVQLAFLNRCDSDLDVVIPAYTHLQRAMPVSASHYWLAYIEKFQRDRDRLADCRKRINISPLGCAALAGSSLPIDRDRTADLLGFDRPAANSLDVSSDRDHLIEFCGTLAIVATHLSGWAEEWILWFSTEFGFISLPEAYTTGSSIMPQKRNPDVPELIRGKSARVITSANQLLVLCKGLPMAYNRDLQEDKPPVFDAFDTTAACLELLPNLITHTELNRDTIAARLEEGFLDATALMEYLIKKGTPMRTAHHTVGALVAEAEKRRCTLSDLSLDDLKAANGLIEADVAEVLGTTNACEALVSYGSGGRQMVASRIAAWSSLLGEP